MRLNKHMALSAACAAAWMRLYWDNLIGDWDGVSDSVKVALVVRFGCWNPGPVTFVVFVGLRAQLDIA